MSWVVGIESIRLKLAPPMMLLAIAIFSFMLIFIYTQIGFVLEIFVFLGVFLAILVGMFLIFPRYKRWYLGLLTKHKYLRWYVGLGIIVAFIVFLLNSQ